MGMLYKETLVGGPAKTVLAIPDHYVAIAYTVKADDAAIDTPTKVLKAGTVYPKNDATAQGIVLQDYNFSDGADNQVAIVLHGFVLEEKLPVAISAAAQAVLPMIKAIKKVGV